MTAEFQCCPPQLVSLIPISCCFRGVRFVLNDAMDCRAQARPITAKDQPPKPFINLVLKGLLGGCSKLAIERFQPLIIPRSVAPLRVRKWSSLVRGIGYHPKGKRLGHLVRNSLHMYSARRP